MHFFFRFALLCSLSRCIFILMLLLFLVFFVIYLFHFDVYFFHFISFSVSPQVALLSFRAPFICLTSSQRLNIEYKVHRFWFSSAIIRDKTKYSHHAMKSISLVLLLLRLLTMMVSWWIFVDRYKWNSVQNMHLIIFRFYYALTRLDESKKIANATTDIGVQAETEQRSKEKTHNSERTHRREIFMVMIWWVPIDSDRPSSPQNYKLNEPKKTTWQKFLWPRCQKNSKRNLPWNEKSFNKKKYLKLLPKNEFRKPTKMPQST